LTGFQRGTLNSTHDGITGPVARSQSWAPDAAGNFTSVSTNGVPQARTHNKQNELTGVGSGTPAYDAAGNLTTDDFGSTLVWDAWNRLRQVTNPSGPSGLLQQSTYQYDALGRRVTEGTRVGSRPTVSMHLYYTKNWQVAEERRNTATAAQAQYVWSPVYVDALVERDRDSDFDGALDERLYALQDANWNVTALVDTSGTVVQRFAYDPYAAATALTAGWSATTDAYAWQYLHQGGRWDPTAGLYSFRYRDYSPTLMRFLQTDPLGFAAGDQNLYRFVANGPTGGLDPFGLQGFDPEGWDWHHLLPQQTFKDETLKRFGLRIVGEINIHDPQWGVLLRRGVHQQGLHPAGWNQDWMDWLRDLQRKGVKEITKDMVRTKMIDMMKSAKYNGFYKAANIARTTENYFVRKQRLARAAGRCGSVDPRVLAAAIGAAIIVAGATYKYDEYTDLGWNIGIDLATKVGLVRALQLADSDFLLPGKEFKVVTQGRVIQVVIQSPDANGVMYITLFEYKGDEIIDLLPLKDSIRKGYRVYNAK
jgi:RHS repeat-associated protein